MSDITYVRREMLPPLQAPGSAIGPVRWARENLFSSWLNSILTLIALYAVYWLVSAYLALVRAFGLERDLAAGLPQDHRRDLGRGQRAAPASR